MSVWKHKLPSYNHLLLMLVIFSDVTLLSAPSNFFIAEVTVKLQILDHNIIQIIGSICASEKDSYLQHRISLPKSLMKG